MLNNKGDVNSENVVSESRDITKECAILALKPKSGIFDKLVRVSTEMLGVTASDLQKYLDKSLLDAHTVPVCMPLLATPEELLQFIKTNSKLLFDIMLTAWPFPIESWKFVNKNIDLIEELVDIKYFPFVCKAITKPVSNTLDLSVTFATPTTEFVNYLAERIGSKKMAATEEELTFLEFITASGIAIVTNKIERQTKQDPVETTQAINDSKHYLSALGSKMLETFFYFYFDNPADCPPEKDNKFLNKWFDTHTYTGMYILPQELFEK